MTGSTTRVKPTRYGVMIDRLAHEVLGSDANGVVENVLGLNPGLAEALRQNQHHLALDQGVRLPEATTGTRRVKQVTLWS